MNKRTRLYLSLGGGLVIAAINIYSFIHLFERPSLPATVDKQSVVKIDTFAISQPREVDFVLSRETIGKEVTVSLLSKGRMELRKLRLVPYYSTSLYPGIYLAIGLTCFVIGTLVILLKREETRAHIFYWTSLAFGSAVITNGGFYQVQSSWYSYFPGGLFYLSFVLAPALLLHFSLTFSKRRRGLIRSLIYIPAILLAGTILTYFFLASQSRSMEVHSKLLAVHRVVQFYCFLFVLSAIFHLVICFLKSVSDEEKAQLKWVFFGLFTGLGPYLLLYQLPSALKLKPLIGEEFSNVFFILIPLTIAISIIKFKLMNIELFINRSLVYSFLTIFTITVYLLSIRAFYILFSKLFLFKENVISVAGAFVAAGAFYPARKKIQELVDKAFFRKSYDYRKSILRYNERASKIVTLDHLVDFFLTMVKEIIPLEHIEIFIFNVESDGSKLLISRDGKGERRSLAYFKQDSEEVLARRDAVQIMENIDFSREEILDRNNAEIIIPLTFKLTSLEGFIPCGKKKSGERFSRDDLELLVTMSRELAVNLERIKLQEEVVFEKAEREKLDELSRMKTEFISIVSHELRTPMSSIQGITEMLQEKKIRDRAKRVELLRVMAGESSRLSRLIHNILDYGKIEQNVKMYRLERRELQPLIKDVAKLFRPQLDQGDFSLKLHLPKKTVYLEVDEDGLKQALTNLVDNALKYSGRVKEIELSLSEKENQVEISVKDRGIGISLEDQGRFFEKYFRGEYAAQYNPKGVGLGLKIVQHIMLAHRGTIKIDSRVKRGSVFTLVFPKP